MVPTTAFGTPSFAEQSKCLRFWLDFICKQVLALHHFFFFLRELVASNLFELQK